MSNQDQNQVQKATKFTPNQKRMGLITALSTLAVGAHAEGVTIDTGDVVTTITNGVTTVSAIGIAVLSLVVVIKVFKWARSAM